MGIFQDGDCHACDGTRQVEIWEWVKVGKQEDYRPTGKMGDCYDCCGTGVELTSMGRELLQFMRDMKDKI